MCILLKISSSVEFVKSLFKNIFRKIILRIEEISIAVFFKQNLLVQKTALVKLTQNVLWEIFLKCVYSLISYLEVFQYMIQKITINRLVQQKILFRKRSTQKLFSSSLCLLVSQTDLVSKAKFEGFGLADQFHLLGVVLN